MRALRNKTKTQQTRSLKIHSDYQPSNFSNSIVPLIRLKGRWLEDLGFTPESRVKVTTDRKKLIIQLEE